VGKATSEEGSFMPPARRPELIVAVRDLATTAVEVLAALSETEQSAKEALASLADQLRAIEPQRVGSGFNGTVISADDIDPGRAPLVKYAVIDGEPE
jgi:hypothetical protein